MPSYSQMLVDTLFGFFALFVLTKVLGKTEISQLTAFDFITAIILGELVGNALFDDKAGILHIGYVLILWGGLLYITEIITQKYKETRPLLEGSPEIVIRKGKLIRDVMKKNKLDINQLQHMLRGKDVFSLREVEYAILETNGTLSVLKKSDFQTPTRKDMKLAPQPANLSVTLVNDGEIIYDNLEEKNLTEEWLMEQLKEQGYDNVNDVFYAEYMKDEDLLVLPFVNRGKPKK
ncbi:YetF domain-containing protein [Ornithinibacillus sp. 179-J 7C1 HS]|uniref:YetF domain-containing protein n=1 Tax=Ornithinibacillus sp. 179-J 7C1 HS TaxID=3142384 RepID=UPI0039A0028B